MNRFKGWIKNAGLIAISLWVSACLRGPEKSSESAQSKKEMATFKAIEVTGKSKEGTRFGTWKLPNEKTYDFHVCLVSRATKSALPSGHDFYIERPDKTKYKSTTDDLGCMTWQEPVAFNFPGNSTYVVLERNIVGSGVYKGNKRLKVGINPWAPYRGESDSEVVDLNRYDLPDHVLVEGNSEVKMALSGLENAKIDLEIGKTPSLNIHKIRDMENGKEVRVSLSFKPFIEPLDMSQNPTRYNFRSGKFRVFYQLVANYLGKGGKKRMILTPELGISKPVYITKGGEVNIQQVIPLKRYVSQGTVQLALKIVPMEAPFAMNTYEGLHEIGPLEKLFGSHHPQQIEGIYSGGGTRFNYSNFITKAANFDELKASLDARDLNAVEYSDMSVRFVRIAPGETNTHRTILYRVSTKVTDMITGAPVRHQKFTVKKSQGGVTQTVVSNGNGFLKWDDSISHVFYSKERYFFPHVNITQVNSGAATKLTMVVNPWDEGWTFGSDLRGMYEFFKKSQATPRRPSKFMVDAFRYQTIRFRYVIDEFMTLNVKKAVVMAMDPLASRDTITKGRAFEPLRDGVYLVKIALVKHFIDPFKNGVSLFRDDETHQHKLFAVKDGDEFAKGEYYTVIQKLLRVQAGRITTPLEFSMRDLRMMSIRNNIMVQMELIDEKKLLKDNIIETKLNELLKEHTLVNAMTPEKKAEYYANFRAEAIKDHGTLKRSMEEHIDSLKAERRQVNELYADRDQAFKSLETQLHDEKALIESIAKRQKFMEKPKEKLDRLVGKIRGRYDQMDNYLEKYWEGWEEKYKSTQKADFHPTSLSYMAAIQQFVNELEEEETDNSLDGVLGITYKDYERMLVNDYSTNPASPYVDLNIYAYKNGEAGLEKRSFIGPCTLIANDNMSEMRPTDNIDEKTGSCDRIDCSQEMFRYPPNVIKENKYYEGSEYHGSLKPYAGKHVDHIIPEYIKAETMYYRKMQARRQVGNFIKDYNLEYVSLMDKIPLKYKSGCKFTVKKQVVDEVTGKTVTKEVFDPFEVGELCVEEVPFKPYEVTRTSDLLTDFNKAKLNDIRETIGRYRRKRNLTTTTNDFYHYFHLSYLTNQLRELPDNLDTLDKNVEFAFGLWKDSLMGSVVDELDREVLGDIEKRYTNYLKNNFEEGKVPNMTDGDLRRWVHGGSNSMSLVDSIRMCKFLSDRVAHNLYEKGFTKSFQKAATVFKNHCIAKIDLDTKTGLASNPVFSVDRRWIVKQTGQYEHKSGKNMNINVGIDFGLSQYKGRENADVVGANWAQMLGKAASYSGKVLGAGGKKAESKWVKYARMGKLGSTVIPMLGELADAAFSVIVNQSTGAKVRGRTSTKATSVSSLTFLVMQKAELEIEVLEHEKCLTSQFNPEFFTKFTDPKDLDFVSGKSIEDEEVGSALLRGLMICDAPESETKKILEDYYYMTQHFTAGDMLDEGNLLNHVWLLALRGKRDFATFINMIQGSRSAEKGEKIKDEEEYALRALNDSYLKLLPTFPGMYTVHDDVPLP